LFYLLYNLMSALLYLLALPLVALLSLKKKYRESIPARFLLRKNPPLPPDGIHFHVCSYGEAKAAEKLILSIPEESRRISTTTQTGFEAVSALSKNSRYLPFEILLHGWIVPQKALVVLEAELWYLLFALYKRRGAKNFLVNARISERSFPRYRRFSFLYRRIFANIDRVYAQSEADRQRLEILGARNITVTGNIKFSSLASAQRALLKPQGVLLCAASTHEGEEEMILEAFGAMKMKYPQAKMVIVPRHPERFAKVAKLMESFADENSMEFANFSTCENFERDLTLMDRMGELVNCYAICDIALIGGSFVAVGGHNAAEAAQFNIPIISGEHYFNQRELFRGISGLKIAKADELAEILMEWEKLPRTSIVGGMGETEKIIQELLDVLRNG